MLKPRLILLSILMCINISTITAQKEFSYNEAWKVIDSLINNRLPKSVYSKSSEIYDNAKREKNYLEMIKALSYKYQYADKVEDEGKLYVLKSLEENCGIMPSPYKEIMHSFTAHTYFDYLSEKYYYIRDIVFNADNKEIEKWTIDDFFVSIDKHFSQSMSVDKKFKKIKAADYNKILTEEKLPRKDITLYELLIKNALTYYFSNNHRFKFRQSNITDSLYFLPNNEFIKQDIDLRGYEEATAKGLMYLQKLAKHIKKNGTLEDIVRTDLYRNKIIISRYFEKNASDLYLGALTRLEEEYDNIALSDVYFEHAYYLYNKSLGVFACDKKEKESSYRNLARQLCFRCMRDYPQSEASSLCKELTENIDEKIVEHAVEEFIPSHKVFPALIKYKNIDSIYLRVWKPRERIDIYQYRFKDKSELLAKSDLLSSEVYKLKGGNDYNKHTAELLIEGMDYGQYILEFSPQKDYPASVHSIAIVNITDIQTLHRNINGNFEALVLDRNTGIPIEGAAFCYWKENWTRGKVKKEKEYTVYSSAEGLVKIPGAVGSVVYEIYHGQDTLYNQSAFSRKEYNRGEEAIVNIFTDRKIYRPGDKVHFKALVYKRDKEYNSVAENKELTFTLRDAGGNEIGKYTLQTNEYGTVEGVFDLPYNVLLGNYSINTDIGGYHNFKVEEYKVPKFEITADNISKEYSYGDTIPMNFYAKTYNNTALANVPYEYKVYRKEGHFRYAFSHRHIMGKLIERGKGYTDAAGNMQIEFAATSGSLPDRFTAIYTCEVKVTDISGETQVKTNTVVISSNSLNVYADIDEISSWDIFTKGIPITALSSNNDTISVPVNLKLIRLQIPDNTLYSKEWSVPSCPIYTKQEWNEQYPGYMYDNEGNIKNYKEQQTVGEYVFYSGKAKQFRLKDANFQQGAYKLILSADDKRGKPIVSEYYFYLYNPHTDDNVINKYLWADISDTEAYPGDTIDIIMGSSEKVYVLLDISVNGKFVDSKRILLNNEQKKVKLDIKEEYRGEMKIEINSVYGNRINRIYRKINVPFNNKKLAVDIKSFRNKMLPGQSETLTFTIKDYKNKPADAEFMLTLYDAALDKFAENDWSFNPAIRYYFTQGWNAVGRYNIQRAVSKIEYYIYKQGARDGIAESAGFIWEQNLYPSGRNRMYGSLPIRGKAGAGNADEVSIGSIGEGVFMYNEEPQYEEVSDDSALKYDAMLSKDIPVRKDFASTAFFYPSLRTNAKGELQLSFTVPESLTRWKMLGVAHTKDMALGYITRYIETEKKLMLNTYSPRFLRKGDKIDFTSKLTNLSDEDKQVNVRIEFIDPITGKELNILKENSVKRVSVKTKADVLLSWGIEIPDNINLLQYTVIAESGSNSDGESSMIPVLNKRVLITKTMPFSTSSSGDNTLIVPDVKKLLADKTKTPERVIVEFASNPKWYAIKALPYLKDYPYENTDALFSKYFANKIARTIIESNPEIGNVYNLWKEQDKQGKDIFLSKLEKNKELRQILTEETPWLADAKTHEESMRAMSLLFDKNNISNENKIILSKLYNTQNTDGGWPWYDDMESSRFITQSILLGMGYISKVTGDKYRVNEIQRAIDWAKGEFIKSYKDRIDNGKQSVRLDFWDIHFLYAVTYFKDMVRYSQEEQIAVDYYLQKCKQYWKDANLYTKGMIALIFYRNGMRDEADIIVNSLKEYATVDDYYGMYWKNNTGGIYVHQNQIEIQSLMIELFSEISDDKESVENMRRWLLNHKRTNSWGSTKATVSAIYALLGNEENGLNQRRDLKIRLGNDIVYDSESNMSDAETGTGYIKKSYSKEEINSDMDRITVSKYDDESVWGALYIQYTSELNDVSSESGGINISKELFIEKTSNGKIKYEKVENNTILRVGDKLKVILTVNSEFPLQYVHIKDLRASCTEPGYVSSGYRYDNGLSYYMSVKDASVNYFIENLDKGKYRLSYQLYVTHSGKYSGGIAGVQCMYAPEFKANTEGRQITVK